MSDTKKVGGDAKDVAGETKEVAGQPTTTEGAAKERELTDADLQQVAGGSAIPTKDVDKSSSSRIFEKIKLT